MGIIIVLIFYAIGMTIAAAFGALVLGPMSYALTKHSGQQRKRAVRASAIFPFTCVAFAAAWFVGYATMNDLVFHRDPGLGDSSETPLPNGYALMMIDTTDQGTVYNPKRQPRNGSVVGQDDAVLEFGSCRLPKG